MRSKNCNIILTGYRATGKSCVGKLLAQRLDFVFLDMDHKIESQAQMSIKQMVDQHGWTYFRNLEKELLLQLADKKGYVVATGGGAIMHYDIWQKLMDTSLVVWLNADINTIASRLQADVKSASQRPSLTSKSITEEIEPILQERLPLYEKGSHISIDTTGLSPDDIVDLIVTAFERHQTK